MSLAIVHIGAGKTGSTAIQNALSFNVRSLAENGVIYPRLDSDLQHGLIDHNRLAYALFDDRSFEHLSDAKRQLAEIAQSGKTLILSAEVFYMRPFESAFTSHEAYIQKKRESIRKLLDMLSSYERIQVVCYVRRQDVWLESIYNERVKQNKHAGQSFEAFVSEMGQGHYAEQLDLWAEYVGKENIIVRPYEQAQLHSNDVVQDFTEQLGIAHLIKPAPVTLATTNPRLSRDILEFEKIIWRVEKDPMQHHLIRDVLRNISEEMQRRSPEPKGWQSLMKADARAALLDSYTESNRRVATTYLSRANGILFEEPIIESSDEAYPGLTVERAIEILMRLESQLSALEVRKQKLVLCIRHWIHRRLPLLRPIFAPIGRHFQKLKTRKRYGY